MAHARITHATQKAATLARARNARRLFFKADHPRAIDQYIDYFGGAGGASAAGDDLCGETLLERLA
ncbi:MAG TPA: hypothetical protein VIE36_24865 [Methylomirabilota bacterium]|jgi:hypothetical protein